MATWNRGISSLCIFCQRETETREHIFFDCAFSAEMWSLLTRGLLGSQFTTVWGDLTHLRMDTTQDKKFKFMLRYTFQITLHCIWWERNDRRHQTTVMVGGSLAKMIDRHIRRPSKL